MCIRKLVELKTIFNIINIYQTRIENQAKKFQQLFDPKSEDFLGYEIEGEQILAQNYMKEKHALSPEEVTRREIRRSLGKFNLCRPMCKNLSHQLLPLQGPLM